MCVAVMLLCEKAKSTVYALPPVGWQSAAVSQQQMSLPQSTDITQLQLHNEGVSD